MTRRSQVITGAVLLAVLAALSVVMAVTGGETVVDQWWHDFARQSPGSFLAVVSLVCDELGGGLLGGLVIPLLVVILVLVLRRRRDALFAAVAFAGSALVVQMLKHLVARARPEDMLVTSDFGSFPSGHTAHAATLAVVLWLVFRRRWIAVAGICWTAVMALSRTALSVHWLSDTLGGALIGVAVPLLIMAAASSWLRRVHPSPHESEESSVSTIRPYRPGDRDALYDVCVRTADAGADATGMLTDDRLWGDIFAVPYIERHPDLCWVVEAPDGRVIGYVLGTDDTEAFETWFRDEWWPSKAGRYPHGGDERENAIIALAEKRGPGVELNAADYPAHLHIDLLPETQGQGLGRRLTQTLFDELRRRGVPALHLGLNPQNTGAAAFYERIGMHPLPAPPGGMEYGIRLDR